MASAIFSAIFPVAALIGAVVQLLVQKQPRTPARTTEVLARWLLVVGIGVVGIFAFLGHVFFADRLAEEIGFPADNPFQWEVAWANAAVGVLGLICLRRRDFWWPTAIGAAIYLWGCAWGHIYQLVVHDNHAPSNAGAVLYMDIFIPLAILILLYLQDRAQHAPATARRTVVTQH